MGAFDDLIPRATVPIQFRGANGQVYTVPWPAASMPQQTAAPAAQARPAGTFDDLIPKQNGGTFEFSAPSGRRYTVQGPPGSTSQQAFQVLVNGGQANADLPHGFVLDNPQQQGVPRGYVLDKPQQPQPQQPQPTGSAVDNAVRTVARGTLGIGSYLDEADAATNALLAPYVDPMLPDSFQKLPGKTFGERYDQALAIQRGKDQSFDTAHPVASTGLQLAGGLASGGAALRAAPAVAKAALGLGGETLASRIGASAVSGAGIGAVQGFGEGQGGLGSRIGSAVGGAGTGAAFGAAVPVVAQGIGRGVQAVAGRIATGNSPLSARAADLIASDLSREGLTLPEANARAAAYGPHGMIADVSPTMQYRTEQIAQSDNPSRSLVINALKTRAAAAGGRINTAYDAAAGATPDVNATLQGILTQRAQQSAPLYEKALSRPVAWNNRLQQFLDDPIVRGGLGRGVEIQRLESLARNEPFNPTDYAIKSFNEAGDPVIGSTPNMRTLNVVKKGLDALVEDNKTDFGRLTERGRAINDVRKSFLNELDSINPDYAAARKSWEGPTKALNAFQRGMNIFSTREHPDILAADLAGMSDAEKDSLRLGVRAAINKAMGAVRNGALKGRTLLTPTGTSKRSCRRSASRTASGLSMRCLANRRWLIRLTRRSQIRPRHGAWTIHSARSK